MGLSACDSGYGRFGPSEAQNSADYSGRLAMSWTLNGSALTADRCKLEHIDSMDVQIASDIDSSAGVEFLNVVCALDRYSAAMLPSGPVTIYVGAIRQLSSQAECVRYAGTGHGTAGADFQQNPVSIALKTVQNCP